MILFHRSVAHQVTGASAWFSMTAALLLGKQHEGLRGAMHLSMGAMLHALMTWLVAATIFP